MTHDDVQRWLDGYIRAWQANDPRLIGDLFTEDASYSFRPWDDVDHTVTGRSAIVSSWIDSADEPDTWAAHYVPYVVEGNRAVAIGWSRYHAVEGDPEKLYHNAYLLEFADDKRCRKLNEFYMLKK